MVMVNSDINQIVREAEERNTIYLFPMGRNGKKIYNTLANEYGIEKMVGVDNYLCDSDETIISLERMSKELEENDIVIVTSWLTEIIGCIHGFISNNGKDVSIIYSYDRKEMIAQYGLRLVHLVDLSDELYRNKTQGAVAEAGVYKGEFAKHINYLFPDRKLYLFDSFEGFDAERVDDGKDDKSQYVDWIEKLKDTSVEMVMKKMRYQNQVSVHKGFIPYTFADIDDRFAFVNLDMDLYQPTIDGLNWFFPRMERGGYIFVHDFLQWEGAHQAVLDFCNERNIGYFILADQCTACLAC